jgi:hypothetical protein
MAQPAKELQRPQRLCRDSRRQRPTLKKGAPRGVNTLWRLPKLLPVLFEKLKIVAMHRLYKFNF